MSKEQIYIDFILEQLDKGVARYTDIFQVFLSKFKVSEPTFAKYYKIANEAYLERRSLINEAKLNETINIEKEAVKTNYIEREKAIEMSSEVLLMIFNKLRNQPEPNSNDINAFNNTMDKYATLTGISAPKKIENTINEIKVIRTDADKIE